MSNKETIQGILEAINDLIVECATFSSTRFQKWYYKTERFIKRYFGNSEEYTRWCEYFIGQDSPQSWGLMKTEEVLKMIRSDFEVYLEELEEDHEDSIQLPQKAKKALDNTKVFIVHGHDGELKESVARVIEKQGIEAIILSEKANQGKTIIEKIEHYSDVGAAICLFTNDDEGREKSEKNVKPRARQNVVLETGFFIGYLGRDRVVLLSDANNEIPGDLSGVVYTNSSNWKSDLGKELEEMGFQIDYKKLFI